MMSKDYFVDKNSIVRQIWGKSDTILFIFAGAAAEFALNKAVDWLYYTGRLPKDPIGRLFSTVTYAQNIVFQENENALKTIDQMTAIHNNLEKQRGMKIPDWAYRDVLYMLIDYSIRAFEVLERKLTHAEKEDIFSVFYRLGKRMNIDGLPESFDSWIPSRNKHLENNLAYSEYTVDLFNQYKKHLGSVRYRLLLEAQTMVVPDQVKDLLNFAAASLLVPLIGLYKFSALVRLDWFIKELVLPGSYLRQIRALDRNFHN